MFALSQRTCRLGAAWATPVALVAAACEATVPPIPQVDRDALVALYEATNGPHWVDNTNWLSDRPLGEWYGVDTDADGRVVKIVLRGRVSSGPFSLTHGLSGEIPPEIGELSSLEVLDLGDNDLSGEIPPELGNLSNLVRLALFDNDLSGEIPPELGNLSNLGGLLLFGNGLSGEIPPELGNLSSLEVLWLIGTGLSGELPPELGNLSNLVRLELSWNQRLSGEIPASFLTLDDLELFRFDYSPGLCAPNTSAFTSWLEGMSVAEGPRCYE